MTEESKLTYYNVYNIFKNLSDGNPDLTEKLINGGYHQKIGGYIDEAKRQNRSNPLQQNWHILIHCEYKINNGKGDETYRFTPCGELLVYMAEVTDAVEYVELSNLVNAIIESDDKDNRKKWNKAIKELCWNNIKKKLHNQCFY